MVRWSVVVWCAYAHEGKPTSCLVCVHTFGPMPISMPARVKRKRARLFTQSELAKVLGCSRSTVQRIESDPLPGDLVAYLNAVGYVVAFYPRRKGKG